MRGHLHLLLLKAGASCSYYLLYTTSLICQFNLNATLRVLFKNLYYDAFKSCFVFLIYRISQSSQLGKEF